MGIGFVNKIEVGNNERTLKVWCVNKPWKTNEIGSGLLFEKRKKQTVNPQIVGTHEISQLGLYFVCNVAKGKGNENKQIELMADSFFRKMKRYILGIDDVMIATYNVEY